MKGLNAVIIDFFIFYSCFSVIKVKLDLNMKPTKVWHFFHLFFILFAVSFFRSMVKIYHSFDFAFHIMSQLVPQMKEEIPQLSEIPQWDSIRILAVQSSGLFLFKLVGIHRITE